MSKIFIFFLLSLVFLSCNKDDNTPIYEISKSIDFIKTIGGSKNDQANSVISTQDGGYAILGFTQSNDFDIIDKSNESFDYWLLKYNANDVLEWSNTYGGSLDDKGNDIIQTKDGGFLIVGESRSKDQDVSANAGSYDFWIVKLAANGQIIWEKSLGFLGVDKANAVVETSDNGFLITGVIDVTASGGLGNSKTSRHAGGDYWVTKINQNGTVLWTKFYGGNLSETPYDLVQTDDDGFLIVGTSDSNDVDIKNNKGSYDFWIIKIDKLGVLVWEKSFGGKEIDEAYGISKTTDGNYIVVGNTRSNSDDVAVNNGDADLWLIKISPSGQLIWEKTFGGLSFEVGRSIQTVQGGDFLVSGSSRSINGDLSINNGQNDVWLLMINSNGSIVWQKSLGGSKIDFGLSAVELLNNDIILVGYSGSSDFDIQENKGFKDMLIVKLK